MLSGRLSLGLPESTSSGMTESTSCTRESDFLLWGIFIGDSARYGVIVTFSANWMWAGSSTHGSASSCLWHSRRWLNGQHGRTGQ